MVKMDKSETVTIIRSLLSSVNTSYGIYQLNRDFKNETGFDIPLYGYSNLSYFLHSIPDTVKVTGIYPCQQVSLVPSKKSAHIVALVRRQRNKRPKKRRFPKGKSMTQKVSVESRTEEIHEPQSSERNTPLEASLKDPDDDFNSENITSEETLKCANADLATSLNSTPMFGTLRSCWEIADSEIPPIEVKFHARVGDYIEVYPCRICSPQKFYFQFRKFKKKFSVFLNDLQIFYATHEDIPKVKGEVIRPKLNCAVFYGIHNEAISWHRAEVHKIIDDAHVLVNLIDNGYMVKISIENLKYLHPNFLSLPRQAVLGSLANIIPAKGNSRWSRNAVKRFFDLSFQKDLIAGVVSLDPTIFCLKLALSCTTKGLEIHINDTLVREGYAEFELGQNHFLPGYFTSMNLNMSSSWKTAKRDCNECEREIDKWSHGNKFIEDVANPVEDSISTKLGTPIFYFSNSWTNNKLEKMFSSSDDKKS